MAITGREREIVDGVRGRLMDIIGSDDMQAVCDAVQEAYGDLAEVLSPDEDEFLRRADGSIYGRRVRTDQDYSDGE